MGLRLDRSRRSPDSDAVDLMATEGGSAAAGPDELARFLRADSFFGAFSEDILAGIAAASVSRHLQTGETLFYKGDAGDALFVIRQGSIEIGFAGASGRQVTLNLLGPGAVLGEIAMLDGQERTADAVAREPTTLFVVRRRDFLALLQRSPSVAVQTIELLCARLRSLSDRMEELMLLPLPVRLARRLIELGQHNAEKIALSQSELATMIGATRESVNRQLNAWQRAGFVELVRGHIMLRDGAALSAAAGLEPAEALQD
jgi:CRP/FNR family transcriptional regulator, cyclic AMP receptor protein